MDEVVKCIRSCLISIKGKADVKQLRTDYRFIMGTDIPFRQFGFSSIEDFFKSIPSLQVTKGPNGQILIDAKPDEKSVHISKLVAKQREKKKKIRVSPRGSPRSNYSHRSSSKWRPTNYGNKPTSYRTSSLPAAVSHNQFVTPPKSNTQQNTQQNPPKTYKEHSVQENGSRKIDLSSRLDASKRQNSEETANKRQNSEETTSKRQNSVETSSKRQNSVETTTKQETKFIRTINLKNNNDEPDFNGHTQSRSKLILPKTVHFELENSSSSSVGSESSLPSKKSILKTPSQESFNISRSFAESLESKPETVPFTGDSLVDLYAFVQLKNLPQVDFKVCTRKTKPHKPTIYDCRLKIGTNSYSTYPNDFTNELSAKQYVAKLALEDLVTKSGRNQQLLLSTADDILQRIPPIVQKHYHGVWNSQLEADYVDMFNEQLPPNWLDIIDTSQCISVEQCFANKFVLRYCKPGEHLQKQTGIAKPLAFEVSIPSNTVSFNENGTLVAEITCIVSAMEIWCRQMSTPEAESFIEMILYLNNALSTYRMNQDSLRATEIICGGYYIAFYENSFIRVRILEVFPNEVYCFQVDFGDECTLPKKDIYNMKREFARNQGQAFICRLAGLEDLYEVSSQSDILQCLVGRQVELELATEDSPNTDPNDPVLSVVMYDFESKECLNKELISQLTIEAATPILTDGINEVYIRHKEANGDLYVLTNSLGLEKFDALMSELQHRLVENSPSPNRCALNMEKLYLAKYSEDNQWYRTKILDFSPCRTYAQIFFVDYGNTQIINVNNETLLPLEEISDILSQFPPQAIRVRIGIDVVPPTFVELMDKMLYDNLPVLLKIMKRENEEGIPLVELYKRSEPDGILFSINKAITLENEMNNVPSAGDNNNNSNKQSQKILKLMSLNKFDDPKNVPSTGSLKAPNVGKPGQYFDVVVPHAVSPWNFFVQPYRQNKELCALQKELQEKYRKTDSFSPLSIEDILPGKIYASKHTDGNWYRTSVIKVIGPGSISVCYCDYGYYSNVSVSQLLALDDEFMALPYQAIKAKLDGIKPCRDKWSLEDCTFFQNLVEKKSFVSVIVSTEKDELYKLDTVLSLNLIDTSTPDDINVSEFMIHQKKAVKVKQDSP